MSPTEPPRVGCVGFYRPDPGASHKSPNLVLSFNEESVRVLEPSGIVFEIERGEWMSCSEMEESSRELLRKLAAMPVDQRDGDLTQGILMQRIEALSAAVPLTEKSAELVALHNRYPVIYVVARCSTPLEDLREAEDRLGVGVWEFTPSQFSSTRLRPEEYVDAALDCYHSQVAIDELDVFEFEVYVDGVLTPPRDDHESYSLTDTGDCDSISADPDEITTLIAPPAAVAAAESSSPTP